MRFFLIGSALLASPSFAYGGEDDVAVGENASTIRAARYKGQSGSGSGSKSSGTGLCYLYENALGAELSSISGNMCKVQCGPLGDSLCPDVCTSQVDIESFCHDVSDDDTVCTDTCTAGCFMSCVQFVSHCCPYGNERLAVSFDVAKQVINLGSQPVSAEDFSATFLYGPKIYPEQFLDSFGYGKYFGPYTIYGAAAAVRPLLDTYSAKVAWQLTNNGLGLVWKPTGLGYGGPGKASGYVLFRADDFLDGLGECGHEFVGFKYRTKINQPEKFKTKPADNNEPDAKLYIIIQDSLGWHFASIGGDGFPSANNEVTVGNIGDIATLPWHSFDPFTMEETWKAFSGGDESSPSFKCIKHVGFGVSGDVEMPVRSSEGPVTLQLASFKAYMKSPMYPAQNDWSNYGRAAVQEVAQVPNGATEEQVPNEATEEVPDES